MGNENIYFFKYLNDFDQIVDQEFYYKIKKIIKKSNKRHVWVLNIVGNDFQNAEKYNNIAVSGEYTV